MEVELLNAKLASLDLAKKDVDAVLEVAKLVLEEQHVTNFRKAARQTTLLAALDVENDVFNKGLVFEDDILHLEAEPTIE